MDDTDIKPALTPKEWARIAAGDGLDGHSIAVDDLSFCEPPDLVAAIAYANHRLPDADPRRILSTDVGGLLGIAEGMRRTGGSSVLIESLHNLAAKLAALLPPE